MTVSRRQFIGGLAAGLSAALPDHGRGASADLPAPPAKLAPAALAQDEAFWREVAGYYDRTQGIVNLEHGYWGKMARPVQSAYIDATRMINAQNSYYGRKGYDADLKVALQRIAGTLGAEDGEIVLTRNATEAIQNLIRQYRGLKAGDAVLFADVDYPSYKDLMRWLQEDRGVRAVQIELPTRASQERILELYSHAFDENRDLKLMLITHVSNQHGLVVPVAHIAGQARRRNIDVICDCAQSWGLLDYRVNELQVDWAAFNLHKWIGSPVGVGALFMRRGSLQKIAPYPGESDPENVNAAKRVHSATSNFASTLAIPVALDFHQAVGGANKEARLRYLRKLWTDEAEHMDYIELLGGADEASWTGIGSFRLAGKNSIAYAVELQQRLENEFGIFTVIRDGLASGACVRITPQVFTSPDEIGQLVDAMKKLSAQAPGNRKQPA